MKKLFLLLTFIITLFGVNSQYNYQIGLNYYDSLTFAKEVISEIRANDILCSNIKIKDAKIGFDSNANLSQQELTSIVSKYATVTYFEKQKLGSVNIPNYTQKYGGTNCTNAGQVCSNSTVSGNNGGYGTQELHDGNNGCLTSYEHQASWYYINIETPGILEMTIGTNVDYDWAIWGPYSYASASSACATLSAPIRCSYSAFYGNTGLSHVVPYNNGNSNQGNTVTDLSESASGDAWIAPINASAGDIYILLVDNYTANYTPFTIAWGGNAGLGCTAIILATEIKEFTGSVVNNNNSIKWSTDSELNNDYFTLEHSSDGYTWKTISKQKTKGDNSNYEFNHAQWNTVNYYRLSMTDLNGAVRSHSELVYIENEERVFIKYYNLMGQEVPEYTKGVVIAIDNYGNKHKLYK